MKELIESYKFWDIVTLWAKEILEHEDIVSRLLAEGVVKEGLRLNSVDTRWKRPKGDLELLGYPYVGYRPHAEGALMILKTESLEHLLASVRKAETPSRTELLETFILKEDFHVWLQTKNLSLPHFWFADHPAKATAS